MSENPTAGAGQPVPPTGNVPDNPPTTGSSADAAPTEHAPTHDGGVAFEEQRQEELAEERRVHADRGAPADAQGRVSAEHEVEHEGTGSGEEPDGTDNA
jgi:hypothetical protein